MTAPRLRVLVVAAEITDAAFAQRVLDDNGDRAETCTDVPEALARLSQEKFDLALVSLSMPRGDGLALVHHLRALYPDLDVVVMSTADEVEEAASAMALGVLSTMVTPLTGDEILVAADRARERRLLISERANLRAKVASSARRNETYARCAAFVAEPDTQVAARRVLEACAAEVDVSVSALYLVEARHERYFRVVQAGSSERTMPEQIQSKDLHIAKSESLGQVGDEIHLLLHSGDSRIGLVVLKRPVSTPISLEAHELLEVIARLASAALTAARHMEAVARAGIKDPETGAYTFAYFGDVAAREIDRAIRHHRAFALLTLQLGGIAQLASDLSMSEVQNLRRLTTQCVLSSVRDSDVVARIEEDQYYLLLPETGLLGALACRRRILERLKGISRDIESSAPGLSERVDLTRLVPSVGISAFPSDGADLGVLLKLSRKRAERARESDWYRLGLDSLPFWDGVERLVGGSDEEDIEPGLGARASMPLEFITHITRGLIRDAHRENSAGTLYLAGDSELSAAVAREVLSVPEPALRTWILGPAPSMRDPAPDLRLPISDPRLKQTALVLCMTERCGYCLVARRGEGGQVVSYHSSDLELVEGLVNALQTTYHLQPELR